MAQKTDAQLTTLSNTVQNETTAAANSASRLGGLLNDLNDSKINNDKISTDIDADTGSDEKVPSVAAVETYVAENSGGVTRSVKVSLSSAEILALNTTPKTIVAAPGAGKLIRPIAVTWRLNYSTAQYSGSNMRLLFPAGVIAQSTFYTGSSDAVDMRGINTFLVAPSDIVNQPVTVDVFSANPTTGSGTVDIYFTYEVITL